MARRYYVNAAPALTLASSLTNSATSCTVSGTFAGWPTQYPYYAVLDYGTAAEEIVLVTAVVGNVATITRGQDGSSAISHPAGATLNFSVVAKDLDEANAHVNATSGVHGLTGHVVGDTDTQTLSGKTLAAPVVTGGATISGGIQVTGNSKITGTLEVTAGETEDANESILGNTTISGNLTVTGTVTGGGVGGNAPKAMALDPLSTNQNVSTAVVNTTYYVRLMDSGVWTISSIGLYIAAAAGNIQVGVFRDNGSGAPGVLAGSGTSIALSATGFATFALSASVTVNGGDWLAVSFSSSTASFLAALANSSRYPTWRACTSATAPGSLASNPTVNPVNSAVPSIWGV